MEKSAEVLLGGDSGRVLQCTTGELLSENLYPVARLSCIRETYHDNMGLEQSSMATNNAGPCKLTK